jgi:hypothetical protein
VLELVPLRSLCRDTRVQREAGTLGHLPARLVRLCRQRLQREDLLPLARTRRDPVRDRRPEQTVDRRLRGRIEREIRVLDIACNQPRALERGTFLTNLGERSYAVQAENCRERDAALTRADKFLCHSKRWSQADSDDAAREGSEEPQPTAKACGCDAAKECADIASKGDACAVAHE